MQRAGQAEAAAAGGGHRGLAEEDALLRPGEGGRSGPVLHQRGPRQRLRPAGGAQLPGAGGEDPPPGSRSGPLPWNLFPLPGCCSPGGVCGQSDGGPHGPLRGWLPGLQGDPLPSGLSEAAGEEAARSAASGAPDRDASVHIFRAG